MDPTVWIYTVHEQSAYTLFVEKASDDESRRLLLRVNTCEVNVYTFTIVMKCALTRLINSYFMSVCSIVKRIIDGLGLIRLFF